MNHPFRFRPATQDAEIFHEVVDANCYNLPDTFRGHEVILDIGANIGAFTYAALTRGACEVHAFEPDRANFEAAQYNLRDFLDRAVLYHAAVWRSDRRDDVAYFKGYDVYTACGHMHDADHGKPVAAQALDDIIREISKHGRRRIDLIKIDCEGAEYPILLTSQLLRQVDCIVGEFHNFGCGFNKDHPLHAIPDRSKVAGYDRFTDAELIPYLRRRGFEVLVQRNEKFPKQLGLFVARHATSRLDRFSAVWRSLKGMLLRQSA